MEIERFTKNRFEWLGAPQPKAILATAADTAAEDAAAIGPEVSDACTQAGQAGTHARTQAGRHAGRQRVSVWVTNGRNGRQTGWP